MSSCTCTKTKGQTGQGKGETGERQKFSALLFKGNSVEEKIKAAGVKRKKSAHDLTEKCSDGKTLVIGPWNFPSLGLTCRVSRARLGIVVWIELSLWAAKEFSCLVFFLSFFFLFHLSYCSILHHGLNENVPFSLAKGCHLGVPRQPKTQSCEKQEEGRGHGAGQMGFQKQ